MRVWLYYRLSRDEDDELNSLTNQRKIIYEYAVTNGHEVVGESFDDNVSGMHFNREGIDKIYEVVEAGKIEAIIVKDLSRLGRHRTQTALFIDYLREHDVRVLSATENIDTFNENDDLIIGFKGLVNDFYARDGSRRVRTGYRQKQKEGIVTIPQRQKYKACRNRRRSSGNDPADFHGLQLRLRAEGNRQDAQRTQMQDTSADAVGNAKQTTSLYAGSHFQEVSLGRDYDSAHSQGRELCRYAHLPQK